MGNREERKNEVNQQAARLSFLLSHPCWLRRHGWCSSAHCFQHNWWCRYAPAQLRRQYLEGTVMGFHLSRGKGAIHSWWSGLGPACLSARHFLCRVVALGEESWQCRRELERIVTSGGREGFFIDCCLGLGFGRLVGSLIIVVMSH